MSGGLASGRGNRNEYLGLLLFGDLRFMQALPPLTTRNTGTNCPALFTTLERKSDSSHGKQPGTVTNPKLFLLDEPHLLSEALESFHDPLLTSILLCRCTWERSGHCRTTVPLGAGTSPGLCLVPDNSTGRVCAIWRQTEGVRQKQSYRLVSGVGSSSQRLADGGRRAAPSHPGGTRGVTAAPVSAM